MNRPLKMLVSVMNNPATRMPISEFGTDAEMRWPSALNDSAPAQDEIKN